MQDLLSGIDLTFASQIEIHCSIFGDDDGSTNVPGRLVTPKRPLAATEEKKSVLMKRTKKAADEEDDDDEEEHAKETDEKKKLRLGAQFSLSLSLS